MLFLKLSIPLLINIKAVSISLLERRPRGRNMRWGSEQKEIGHMRCQSRKEAIWKGGLRRRGEKGEGVWEIAFPGKCQDET